MSLTNAQLAQKISNLIDTWRIRDTEYANWVSGTADGGPYLNGTYPLTTYLGDISYVKSPAALQASVDGPVASALVYRDEAQGHAATASAAQSAAVAARDLALSYQAGAQAAQALAESAQVYAQAAEANAQTHANSASGNAAAAALDADDADAARIAAEAARDLALSYRDAASGYADDAAASAAAAATFDPANYYTKSHIDSVYFTGTQLVTGSLDGRYYTESEITSLLSGKSDTAHTHSYLPLAGGGTLTGTVYHNDSYAMRRAGNVANGGYLNADVFTSSYAYGSHVLGDGIQIDHCQFTPPYLTEKKLVGGSWATASAPAASLVDGRTSNAYSGGDTIAPGYEGVRYYFSLSYVFIDLLIAAMSTNGNNVYFMVEAYNGSTWNTLADGTPYSTSSWPGFHTLTIQSNNSGYTTAIRVTITRDQVNGNYVDIGKIKLLGCYGGLQKRLFDWDSDRNVTIYGALTTNGTGLTTIGANLRVSGGYLYGTGGNLALTMDDTYLRLNQSGHFTNGVYTPYNFRCDGTVYFANATSWINNSVTSYGSVRIGGNLGGYAGIQFYDAYDTAYLMVATGSVGCGMYGQSLGWRFYYNGTTMTVQNNTRALAWADWGLNAKMTRSTSGPSGGSDGDLWFQYT